MNADVEPPAPKQLAQGDPALLDTELARRLLASRIPARMAFVAKDGTPRVVSSWFHWNGSEVVMVTFIAAPDIRHPAARIAALRTHPTVALSIDTESFPPEILTIRGNTTIEEVNGIAPEYREMARRYLGVETGDAIVDGIDGSRTRQARIVVEPAWVGLIDFDSRLPSANGGVL